MYDDFVFVAPAYDSGSFLFATNLGGGLYWDTFNLADFGVITFLTAIPEPRLEFRADRDWRMGIFALLT